MVFLTLYSGIEESDMRFLRSSMAMAMLAAVKECIMRMMDLNLLNQNGVAPVSPTACVKPYLHTFCTYNITLL